MHNNELELCYLESGYAYFQEDHMKATGDDWNDVPYEHNAGLPYGKSVVVMWDDRERYDEDISPIFPNHNMNNSPFSVDDINKRKRTPWVIVELGPIMAGTTIRDFLKTMEYSHRTAVILGEEGE